MFKLRLVAAAAIACAVTLLSSGAAQAYPDCGISLSLNNATLVGGGTFTYTADAGTVDCDWTVTYRDKVKKASGTSVSGSFKTPAVNKKTTSTITAECTHEATESSAAVEPSDSADVTPAFYSATPSDAVQAADVTCPVTAKVTLLPAGLADNGDANSNGLLPNTGGASFWILLLGAALVLGGGGVTYASRRRHQH